MGHDTVLNDSIIECFKEDLLNIPSLHSLRNLPQKIERLVGKVLVDYWFEAGHVDYVGDRAQPCFFF